MRLYFVRHGQSENNALLEATGNDDGRNDDPKLTGLGQRQAFAVARYLAESNDPLDGEKFGITHVYCSLMERAIKTGAEISRATGLRLSTWKDWHECGGIFLENKAKQEFLIRPGMTQEELYRCYPEIQLEPNLKLDGWWNRPFESEEERSERARRVLRELLERHGNSEDRVVVVSHGEFYVRFIMAMIGLDNIMPVWFKMNNTAISRFDFVEDDKTLVFHNHLAHLDHELIS